MLRNLISQAFCRAVIHNHHPYAHPYKRAAVCSHFRPLALRYFSQDTTTEWPLSIKDFLRRENITKPTPVQEKTLPSIMANRDLVGIARTGSGKTLGFVIPAVMKILKTRAAGIESSAPAGPTCLVLAPTRELAAQTANVFEKFNTEGIKSLVLVGGASRERQVKQLNYGKFDVYIATPGRLNDLITSGLVELNDIKYLVLDEADRMLDMGFEPQVRSILRHIPKTSRQTLMWSATWPQEIRSLASEFMNDYDYVAIDSEKLKANTNIKQLVEVCDTGEKFKRFMDHIREHHQEGHKTLVFVNTKRFADQLLMQLMRSRFRAVSMHGDRTQAQREQALRSIRSRPDCILIATDVAARGLDINDITHVINYDFPNTIEDYIHRIGRTARHEKTGTSLTFVTMNDAPKARDLIKVLEESNQDVPEELRALARQPVRSKRFNPANRYNHYQDYRRYAG